MTREASACDLKDLVAKFIPEAIGKEIEKACQGESHLREGESKSGVDGWGQDTPGCTAVGERVDGAMLCG